MRRIFIKQNGLRPETEAAVSSHEFCFVYGVPPTLSKVAVQSVPSLGHQPVLWACGDVIKGRRAQSAVVMTGHSQTDEHARSHGNGL